MNSWKVILATMVIFGTGVLTGGLLVKNTSTGTVTVVPRNPARFTNQPPLNVKPMQLSRMDFLLRAGNELDLTPEQHDRVEKIIREGQEKSRKLWDGIAPEMRKELQLVHERIRAELNQEQRHKFEKLYKNPPRPLNSPEPGPQMFPERIRERARQGNANPPFNPNAPQRPFRRDNPPPPGNTNFPPPPPQPSNPPAPDAPPAQ